MLDAGVRDEHRKSSHLYGLNLPEWDAVIRTNLTGASLAPGQRQRSFCAKEEEAH